jgi:guanylate kinase
MNKLEHLAELQSILKNYRVSEAHRPLLQSIKVALLAAPTSSGRNTLIRELVKTGEYHYIVSDTTRKPRINDGVPEKDGVEYWFRTEEQVLYDLQAGNYVEAAIIHNQQVSAISVRELEKAQSDNKTAITDIEIMGVETLLAAKPDAIALFVLPPSFEEWQRRIKHRGEMTPGEFQRRLDSACKEFEAALAHDYYQFVINDTIEHAVQRIHDITQLNKHDPEEQRKGRQLVQELYVRTHDFLEGK